MHLIMVVRQGDTQEEVPFEADSAEQAHQLAQGKVPQGAELVGIYEAQDGG